MFEVLFVGYRPIVIESSEEGFEEFIDKVESTDSLWWRIVCMGMDPRRDGAIWFDPLR